MQENARLEKQQKLQRRQTGRTEEGRENMFPWENTFSPLGETVRENMFPWENMFSPRGETVPARVKEKEARGE